VNDTSRKDALRNAVAEWQRRHGIGDDDPLMATVELWEALLDNTKMPNAAAAYHQFRQELEQLDRLAKSLTKQSGEVIRELRTVPKVKEELWMFPYFTVFFVAIGALITGMLIGKFVL
jgi:hypothetical protein